MAFDYTVGFYRGDYRHKDEQPDLMFAKFSKLDAAKEYVELKFRDISHTSSGFMFIDAPEGVHIWGEQDFYTNKRKWYSPNKILGALLYDSSIGATLGLRAYLPEDDFHRLTKGEYLVNLQQKTKIEHEKASIHERLSENKKMIEARTMDRQDIQQERAEKQHSDNPR